MTGSTELVIILGVALLLFGPTKLPQLGKAIGESIRNFRKGINNLPESKTQLTQTQNAKTLPTQSNND